MGAAKRRWHSCSERGELHSLYRIGATRFTIDAVAGTEIAARSSPVLAISTENFGMLEGAEVRLAVDIGGTFTDIVLDVGAARTTRKLLPPPARPEAAVLAGMRLILAD